MKYKNNPFNIRKSSSHWLGSISKRGDKFESFSELAYGVRAFFILMRTYSVNYGLDTISSIIKRFAPPSENDTQAYIDYVCNVTCLLPNQVLSSENYFSLAKAMAFYETRTNLPIVTLRNIWKSYQIVTNNFPDSPF